MAIEASQLTIKVVSDGIDKATTSLNKLAEASSKVESSTLVVKTSTDASSVSTANAAKVTTSYIDRLTAKVDLLGKNNAQAAAYTATQKGLADGEIRLASSLGAQIDSWKELSKVQEDAIKNKARYEAALVSQRKEEELLTLQKKAQAAQSALDAQYEANSAAYIESKLARDAEFRTVSANALKLEQAEKVKSAAASINSAASYAKETSALEEMIYKLDPVSSKLRELASMGKSVQAAFNAGAISTDKYNSLMGVLDTATEKYVTKQKAVAKAAEEGAGGILKNAGAMREFFVILREGARGDFTRMAGSISIFVDRLNLMNVALAVASSPLTWLVGVLTAVGVVALKGADESNKFNQALILTGDYAGMSAGQMELLAAGMSKIGGQHAAAEALTEVANTGKFAGEQVELVGKAALEMNQMTGVAVKDTVKQFEELAKSPAEAVYKLNEQYHFLTASVYEQIRSLEEQGKHQEAATLAMKAYADAVDQRTPAILANLGYMEKGWRAVKETMLDGLNVLMSWGRPDVGGLQEKAKWAGMLASNLGRIQKLSQAGGQEGLIGQLTAENKTYEAKIDAIDAANRATEALDKQKAAQTALNQAGLAADKQTDDHLTRMKGEYRLLKDMTELTQRYTTMKKAYDAGDKTYAEKLKGVNFGADGKPISGGLFDVEKKDYEKKDQRAAPRGNDYGINKQIQDNKNAIQALVDSTKLGMDSVKAQYDRNEIDTETYLQKDYLLKADAYAKEYALAEKNLEIARQKKNVSAISAANKEIQKLQDGAVKDAQAYTDSLSNLDAKRKRDVDKYTDTLVEAYNNREAQIANYINSAGMSVAERDLMARKEQVMKEYRDRMMKLRDDLEKGEVHGGIGQATFDDKADKAYEIMQRQLAREEQFTAEKLKLQGDWVVGAKTAFNDYKNNADDVAAQTQNAFTDAFKGMEDVLTTFIRTGKLSFSSLVDTILADMARMEAKKFMSSLMGGSSGGSGWIGSLMSMGMSMMGGGAAGMGDAGIIASGVSAAGGMPYYGAYADGGDPPLNVPSLVGERGPELFIPKQAGTIVPNEQLGGGSTTITYAPTIHIDSRTDRAQVMQDVQNVVKAGNAKLVDDLKRRRMI